VKAYVDFKDKKFEFGRAMLDITASLAKLEREAIRRRVNTEIAAVKARRVHCAVALELEQQTDLHPTQIMTDTRSVQRRGIQAFFACRVIILVHAWAILAKAYRFTHRISQRSF
jgi:hypothetical protein